jgi:membrane protease subunit HflK
MSWNQGGNGGPWGSGSGGGGDKNPWSGNRGPGKSPDGPDIDEIIRRSQEKFRSFIPGGGSAGGPKGTAFLAIAAVLVLVALQGLAQGNFLGFYRINDGEVAVVQRFGAVVREEQPGLRWLVPLVENYTSVSTSRIHGIEIGTGSQPTATTQRGREDNSRQLMMLTGDSNIVDMQFTVQWRVVDPRKYLFNMREPETALQMAAESVMREVMGQSAIMTAIGSGREAIRQDVEKRLRDLIASYDAGIGIDSVQLQRMEAPAPVIDAFIKAQNAQQEANRARNLAEGYRSTILPQARADANRMMEEARAYKAQTVAGAQGDADRFTQVYNAYRLSAETTSTRLYLETMEYVLGSTNKVIMEGSGAERVMPYLPLNQLTSQSPRSAPAVPASPAAAGVSNSN